MIYINTFIGLYFHISLFYNSQDKFKSGFAGSCWEHTLIPTILLMLKCFYSKSDHLNMKLRMNAAAKLPSCKKPSIHNMQNDCASPVFIQESKVTTGFSQSMSVNWCKNMLCNSHHYMMLKQMVHMFKLVLSMLTPHASCGSPLLCVGQGGCFLTGMI